MQVIEPLGHHELLIVIVQLLVLLVTARTLGEAFGRVGQPAVVGELLAGVLLGPSVLGVVAPGVYESLFVVAEAQFHLLEIVSWVGLIMLLVVTGLETDIDLIVSKGPTAAALSLGGIVVPFATGFGLGWYLPVEFIASPDQRLVFSLFIATAMSISAIPVIAKVLIELEVVRRDIGQLILAAGMVDDTIGWILLATVAGLARSGVVDVDSAVTTLLSVVVFLGIAFTVGRRVVETVLRRVDNAVGSETALVTTLMVLALAAGAITQYLGLEAILGAFVVGILVGQVKRFGYSPRHTFEVVTLGVFAPVFFAIAGLRMDVAALFDPTVFAVSLVVLGVACFGKFAGVMGASRLVRLSRWEGIAIGGGMNARGAMEIIVATIGLGLGILTNEMYSIIVMVAIVTSLMAPAIMRFALPRIEMSEGERARLEREARQRRSFVGGMRKVLLPTRCSVDSQFAAQLLGYLTRGEDIEVTTMYVERGEGRPTAVRSPLVRLRSLADRARGASPPASRSDGGRDDVGGDDGTGGGDASDVGRSGTDEDADVGATEADDEPPGDARRCLDLMRLQLDLPDAQTRTLVRRRPDDASGTVLAEAERGYDFLVLGVADRGDRANAPLFSPPVDEVVRDSPCPVMVVSTNLRRPPDGGRERKNREPIRRILVPTVGTEYTRHAAEVAFTIARECDAAVELVHVVTPPRSDEVFADRPDMRSSLELGEEIVDAEADLGREMGVDVRTSVFVGETDPEEEVVALADERGHDLVVLGSNLRPLSGRAFFGHRVEYIARNAPCPVAVVSSR
ncbi:cation:proton antiporter domain-containing protein [Halegenticoccus tardaugens]|uniref:cation:proton antiporter domain-containing protein n=1 Tax=Halegenticoccus tardaugens TaxID=2071624 RepID=UPI00100C03E5|nr:cation:proton antiporter [Halegenticoccus tardaugens]